MEVRVSCFLQQQPLRSGGKEHSCYFKMVHHPNTLFSLRIAVVRNEQPYSLVMSWGVQGVSLVRNIVDGKMFSLFQASISAAPARCLMAVLLSCERLISWLEYGFLLSSSFPCILSHTQNRILRLPAWVRRPAKVFSPLDTPT